MKDIQSLPIVSIHRANVFKTHQCFSLICDILKAYTKAIESVSLYCQLSVTMYWDLRLNAVLWLLCLASSTAPVLQAKPERERK